jgi:hypothetical protein
LAGGLRTIGWGIGPSLGVGAAVGAIIAIPIWLFQWLLVDSGTLLFSAAIGLDVGDTAFEERLNAITTLGRWLPVFLHVTIVAAAAAALIAAVAASRAIHGERTTVLEALAALRERPVPCLLVLAAVAGIEIAVVAGPGLLSDAAAAAGVHVPADVVFLAEVLALVAGTFLWVRLAFAVPIVAQGGATAGEALAQSWRLSGTGFWRLAGFWAVGALVAAAPAIAVGFLSSLVQTVAAFGSNAVMTTAWALVFGFTLAIAEAAAAVLAGGYATVLHADQQRLVAAGTRPPQ